MTTYKNAGVDIENTDALKILSNAKAAPKPKPINAK